MLNAAHEANKTSLERERDEKMAANKAMMDETLRGGGVKQEDAAVPAGSTAQVPGGITADVASALGASAAPPAKRSHKSVADHAPPPVTPATGPVASTAEQKKK